jgi:hypothetical protein
MSKHGADRKHEITRRINRAWRATDQKIDWLGLETTLRLILREASLRTPELHQIDEAVAAFTRRGNEYSDTEVL